MGICHKESQSYLGTEIKEQLCLNYVGDSSYLVFFFFEQLPSQAHAMKLSPEPCRVQRVTRTTFGLRSDPCCMRVPMVNQKLLASEN